MQEASAQVYHYAYSHICDGHTLLLSLNADFFLFINKRFTLSDLKGAKRHTVHVGRVVVVDVAIVIDVPEVVVFVRVGRPQPPVVGGRGLFYRV